jgi:diguanylate cyclase (GGDEF)-like protein
MAVNEAAVLEMILRQCAPREILGALCQRLGSSQAERQAVFFLLFDEVWEMAATGDLTAASAAILSGIDPGDLSLGLFEENARSGGASVLARHLYSGPGELMGMLVCLGPEPAGSTGRAEKLDATCRLAVLAIEQRNLLEELTWQADHDALTGLYTRLSFERLLGRRLQIAGTALLCINLDRFRLINTVLGDGCGNIVLKNVARRFQGCLPPRNVLARIGGDEFAVLTDPECAESVAASLLQSLNEPFSIDEHQLHLGASIGVSSLPPGSSAEALQREAYIALYHARRVARGKWLQFDPFMAVIPPERLEMEMCLRSALARNEMQVHYQAQVDLASNMICGAEALMRWKPAGLGMISPATFIPILEETGLILEFGRWVLREACVQGIAWRRETGVMLRLAVNVSAVQFVTPGFADDVASILAETGFPPASLELELTESLFVGNYAQARAVFEQLQRLGIMTAVDDFGVGQSSLSYLHELPFDRLKIDQSFVRTICSDQKSRPLIENLVRLARSFGMSTIAEGIEQEEQREIIHSVGCDEGQGYLFAKPLHPDDFLAMWLEHTARCAARIRR